MKKIISQQEKIRILNILEQRFEKNKHRHFNYDWNNILSKLNKNEEKLWSLFKMEETGGEPDIIEFNYNSNKLFFCDCSTESPKGRRSLCYDNDALISRKEFKPKDSAMNLARFFGIELLDETQYKFLQSIEKFDTKSSSWLKTDDNIRKLGGAIFGDNRYNHVFIYHNGAESYYASRGFRGILSI